MVPNRIRLSAVGRSRRLNVEARGFRGSAPVSVFYVGWPKSTLTDRASWARAWTLLVQFAQPPGVGGVLEVLSGFHQLVRVAGELAGVGLVSVLGTIGQ